MELGAYLTARSVEAPGGCREWAGCLSETTKGYGVFTREQSKHYAHRAAYRAWCGEIPRGMFVCHTCDNRKCVNPEHLFLGSNQDNMDDMNAKGRGARLVGIQVPSARLTEHAVQGARALHFAGESVSSIARRFGVSHSTMNNAVKRKH